MELELFYPGDPTGFVPQINTAGPEGLTGLIQPTASFKTSTATEVEQLITHNLETPDAQSIASTLPSQDLNLTLATTSLQNPDSTDPITGQGIAQADAKFNPVIEAVYPSLTDFADDKEFATKITSAFGNHFNAGALEDLRQHWAANTFEQLPTVQIRSAEELKGAKGAFSQDTNTIYLSREYIKQNVSNPEAITSVLLEETGHYIDSRINSSDAAGDEGAIFAALVQNVRLDQSALQALKAEDDTATIALEGEAIQVEQAANVIKNTNYSRPDSGQYRVALWGDDSNSGLPGDPWRTLEKALDSAPSGSTVVMRKGTYREGDLKLNKQLTLQPYGREKVWIKGSVPVNDWVSDGSMWRKDNWTYEFTTIDPASPEIDDAYPQAGHLEMVFINGRPLTQVLNKWEVAPGKFYLDQWSDQLFVGTDPSGKTVEASTIERGMNVSAEATGSAIKGLGFSHYGEKAIHVNGPNILLENNTFSQNGFNGVSLTSTDGHVKGNTFIHNGNKGLNGSRADRTIVENNVFSRNNTENFAKNFGASGSKFSNASNLVFRDNIYERNNATGLWVDISSTDATIVRNISRHNEEDGIFFELSHDGIIASNLAHDNGGVGIKVHNSTSAQVFNNTLAENAINLSVGDTSRSNPDWAEYSSGITWQTADTVVKNNLFSDTKGTVDGWGSMLVNIYSEVDIPGRNVIAAMNNNGYHRTSSSSPGTAIRYKPTPSTSNMRFETVPEFTGETGFETSAVAVDDVKTNPFLMNETKGNYRLKAETPTSGEGEPLPWDIANAIGVPAGEDKLGALKLPGT